MIHLVLAATFLTTMIPDESPTPPASGDVTTTESGASAPATGAVPESGDSPAPSGTPDPVSGDSTAGDTVTPANAAPAKAPAKPAEPGFGIQQMFPFLIMGLLFYLMLIRPQQKEHRRRQGLLNALKKNDRVVTTGGIIGSIADISSDGKMVTLKVDDSTRIKFLRSAIQGVHEEKSDSAT